jgi:hypothetical protein
MSFYERNSMASKRSYETYMEVATVYQHAIAHLKSLHDSLPEEWIEQPGSITSNNEHRMKRHMKMREPADEADAMVLPSYDMHDLLQANLAGVTAAMYDPQGTSQEIRKVEQQEQDPYEDMNVPCLSSWEKNKQNWITLYHRLQKNPAKESKDPKEKRAGLWQMHIRAAYKKGRLSQERIDEMEAIPGWKWGTQREGGYTWEEHLQHWVTQYEKQLRTPSSHSKDLEEKRAGMWQGTQRVAYKNGTLSQERINKLLETPGWEWRTKAYRWEEHIQHMITHYDTLLQTSSKKSNNPEEKQADVWQDMLRTTYTHGTLSQDHVNELKGNPEWEWGVQREITYTWEEHLQHWITQYEKLQWTPSTKSKDPEEKRAGIWQSTQRTAYKHGTLSHERINKLLETPGWEWGVEIYGWEEQRNNWVTVYTKIQKYPSQISKDPEEKRAGIWQSIQRAAYKKATLSQERINELDAIPGWTWSRR